MARAQAGWKGLDDVERRAWNNAAGNRTFPDALGVKRSISGYQLWMKQALSFYGTPYASDFLPPVRETPGWASLTWTQNLSFLRLWPALAADPGVNIVWVVNGIRPCTDQPITNFRRLYFVTATVAAPGAYVNISASDMAGASYFRTGEYMLFRVYGIALDCWVGSAMDLMVQWS